MHELYSYSKNIGVKKSRVFSVVRKRHFHFESNVFIKNQIMFPKIINPEFANRMNVFEKLLEHDVDITGTSITDVYEIKKAI